MPISGQCYTMGQLFHVLMLCLQKSPTIIIMISDPCGNLLDVFFITLKEDCVQALNQGRRNAISTWREWGGAALENPRWRREFVRGVGGGV